MRKREGAGSQDVRRETREVAEIAVVGRVTGFAGLGGVDDVHELAGGDVMVLEAQRGGGEIEEGLVEVAH